MRARGKNRGSYSIAWEDGEESAQRPDIYLHFLLPDPPSAELGVDFPNRSRNRSRGGEETYRPIFRPLALH